MSTTSSRPSLLDLALKKIALDPLVTVESLVSQGKMLSLTRKNGLYAISCEVFLADLEGTPADRKVLASGLDRRKVATAIERRMCGGGAAIEELLGVARGPDEPWPLILLDRAPMGARHVMVVAGLAELPRGQWCLAVGEHRSDEVEYWELPSWPLLAAVEAGTSPLAAALLDSPAALAAVCRLDPELAAMQEAEQIAAAAPPGKKGTAASRRI